MKVGVREYKEGDAEELYALVVRSSRELKPWMPWLTASYSINDTRQWVALCIQHWESRVALRYVVVDTLSGTILGTTGLEQIAWGNKVAELGYWIGSQYVNQGVATAAAKLTVEKAFSQHGINRIEINILPDNVASNRVAKKMGSTFEGVFRNKLFHNGSSKAANGYSIVPEDYKG